MRRKLSALLSVGLLVSLLAACSGDGEPAAGEGAPSAATSTEPSSPATRSAPTEPASGPPTPTVADTVATGLTSPWGLAFLPGGGALVSERDTALVKLIGPTGEVSTVGTVPGVDTTSTSEGGLLGIALHPDFPDQPYLYAYLTAADDNRVVRMTYADGELGTPEVLLDGIPKAENHNGGRLAFGPDGMLYATTGDATEGGNAPDPDSLGGKILRLTPGGDPAPGNPDPGSPVWTSGHRNVQGIAWDDDDNLWASEFGQDTWDELNLIAAGNNYGWPRYEGSANVPGFVDPDVQWRPDEASPSGVAYADGAIWVAGLGGERLWRVEVDGSQVIGQPEAFLTGDYGRLRTVMAAPDGSLWLTTSNTDGRGEPADDDDRILRITLA